MAAAADSERVRCGVCAGFVSQDDIQRVEEEWMCNNCLQSLNQALVQYPEGFCCDVCLYTNQNPEHVLSHSKRRHGNKLQMCGSKKCAAVLEPRQMKRHIQEGHSIRYFKYQHTWYRRY